MARRARSLWCQQEWLLLRARPHYGRIYLGQPFSESLWAKGSIKKTGRPIINASVKYGKDPTPVSPGGGGAHSWSPMSFNPQTGLVYSELGLLHSPMRRITISNRPSRGRRCANWFESSDAGYDPETCGTRHWPGAAPGGNVSTLVAWDPVNKRSAGVYRWATAVWRYGLSTASTLIPSRADGRLIAYTADKGRRAFRIAYRVAERFEAADHLRHRRQAVRRDHGRLGRYAESGARRIREATTGQSKSDCYIRSDGKAPASNPGSAPAPSSADPHQ